MGFSARQRCAFEAEQGIKKKLKVSGFVGDFSKDSGKLQGFLRDFHFVACSAKPDSPM